MRTVAIALAALAACADTGGGDLSSKAQAQPAVVVTFEGALTSARTAALIDELAARPGATLRLTSGGGDENAALDVAEYVERNQVRVELAGLCASACANSILMASPDLKLGRDSVIAFHHSAVSIEENYHKLGQPVPADIARAAQRLRELYTRRGVDVGLLECSARMIGLTQEAVEIPVPGRTTPLKGWRTLRRWWTPLADTLQGFGVRWSAGRPRDDSGHIRSALEADARLIAYGSASDCRDMIGS